METFPEAEGYLGTASGRSFFATAPLVSAYREPSAMLSEDTGNAERQDTVEAEPRVLNPLKLSGSIRLSNTVLLVLVRKALLYS